MNLKHDFLSTDFPGSSIIDTRSWLFEELTRLTTGDYETSRGVVLLEEVETAKTVQVNVCTSEYSPLRQSREMRK
jgi:hypothetical protein